MRKGILYYTCNSHDRVIELACRRQLDIARGDLPLGCASRQPTEYGDWNIVVDAPRGPLTLHRQVLAGLKHIDADVIFLAENDVLYHPSHFEFEPERADTFYYNTNVWRMRYSDGHAVWTDDLQQTSGLCAYRELLEAFYRSRIAKFETCGFDRHFEPGPKTGSWKTANWQSPVCNVDIRHNGTFTRSKWRPEDFRNQRYARGWRETDDIPGWGRPLELLQHG